MIARISTGKPVRRFCSADQSPFPSMKSEKRAMKAHHGFPWYEWLIMVGAVDRFVADATWGFTIVQCF